MIDWSTGQPKGGPPIYQNCSVQIAPGNENGEFDKGPSAAAREVFAMLKQLWPEGDLQMDAQGNVTIGPNARFDKMVHPQASMRLALLILSKHPWFIHPTVADPSFGREMRPHPVTIPDNKKNGSTRGVGTFGHVWLPTSRSTMIFGHLDSKGRPVIPSLLIILAHELLGHASHNDRGIEDDRDLSKAGRQTHNGHDKTIKVENMIGRELLKSNTIDVFVPRGLHDDLPGRGESWELPKLILGIIWP
jgi:hypothetical protein